MRGRTRQSKEDSVKVKRKVRKDKGWREKWLTQFSFSY
jgi:hypothetical protein